MSRTLRNFNDRPEAEKRFLADNTWCSVCNAADIGLRAPTEYEENGKVFIEGTCKKCGNIVVSQVTEKQVK